MNWTKWFCKVFKINLYIFNPWVLDDFWEDVDFETENLFDEQYRMSEAEETDNISSENGLIWFFINIYKNFSVDQTIISDELVCMKKQMFDELSGFITRIGKKWFEAVEVYFKFLCIFYINL